MGGKDRSDGVGMFVAEKWVDSVMKVERHNERVLILKMILDNGLLNVLTFTFTFTTVICIAPPTS